MINHEGDHVHLATDFHLIEGSLEAMQMFCRSGIPLFVITNQAGIAKGMYNISTYEQLTHHMLCEFSRHSITVEKVLYCPHHPQGSVPEFAISCQCRKPGTGLLRQAFLGRPDLRPENCLLIGDKNSDIEAGRRMGLKTTLVKTGHGQEHAALTKADRIHDNLLDAARFLLQTSARSGAQIPS